MFWSDVSHKVIAAARLDGTGLTILVNSSINVPGNVCWFVQCYKSIPVDRGLSAVESRKIVGEFGRNLQAVSCIV